MLGKGLMLGQIWVIHHAKTCWGKGREGEENARPVEEKGVPTRRTREVRNRLWEDLI